MPTLLAIGVSPRYEYSTSRKLTSLFVEKWQAAHHGGKVIDRDLTKNQPPVRRPPLDRWRFYAC